MSGINPPKMTLSRSQYLVYLAQRTLETGAKHEDARELDISVSERAQNIPSQNFENPTAFEPLVSYCSPVAEKVDIVYNQSDPILDNNNKDNSWQLTLLTDIPEFISLDVKKTLFANDEAEKPNLSANHSVSNFSLDDSVEDPDFIPTSNEDRSNLEPKEDHGNKLPETKNNEANEHSRSRKRIRREDNWKRNVKRRNINSGQEYVSRLGKKHQAKTILPACGDKCIFQCSTKINFKDRSQLFKKYYEMCDKTLQREYLARNIEKIAAKSDKIYKKKTFTCAYFFHVNNVQIRVCKLFFKATLNISNCAIDTVLKKKNEYGIISPEKRGKHSNRANKIDDTLIQGVVNHINSFPRTESHYCRSITKREYLEGSLNISLMYKLYREECLTNERPFVKQHFYQEVFNTKFNLGFFKPKKDLCLVCEIFRKLSEEEKFAKKADFEKHQEEKTLSRLEKRNDKEAASKNKNIMLCSFDLQAVTPLPNGNVSTFYYKSKLNVYNFTIFNISEKSGLCYMWQEGEAKRGANEISTYIFDYIKRYCFGKEVIFYSDNCSAQNKNKYLMSMYLYVIERFDVEQITHKYLIVGHTENEGDSMHSCIEKEQNRILKSGPLYVPSELVTIVKAAKKKGNVFSVTEMSTEDFLDWKKVSEVAGKNFNKNEKGDKVCWKEIKVITVRKDNPNKIFYKKSYADEDYNVINVRRTTRTKRSEIALTAAYSEAPSIPANKKNDLNSLCEQNLIPKKHHHFFMSLKATANHNNSSDDNSD